MTKSSRTGNIYTKFWLIPWLHNIRLILKWLKRCSDFKGLKYCHHCTFYIKAISNFVLLLVCSEKIQSYEKLLTLSAVPSTKWLVHQLMFLRQYIRRQSTPCITVYVCCHQFTCSYCIISCFLTKHGMWASNCMWFLTFLTVIIDQITVEQSLQVNYLIFTDEWSNPNRLSFHILLQLYASIKS